MNKTRVTDLTVDELKALIREAVREASDAAPQSTSRQDQRALLEIPPLNLGGLREGVQLIGREEYYGDDGR